MAAIIHSYKLRFILDLAKIVLFSVLCPGEECPGEIDASKTEILVSIPVEKWGREQTMTRMMQWILLAGIFLLITPELLPAQEQMSRGQTIQSAEQSEGYTDDPQQMELERLRSERSIKQMESRYIAAKYYALLSLIAFAVTVLGVVAIVALVFFVRARRERRRHELIRQYLEKGQEVPRELLAGRVVGGAMSAEQWAAYVRWRDLRRGTCLLCLGLGSALAIYLWYGTPRYVVWCFIILFLSVGFYINALFFSGKSDSNRKRESDD